MADKSIGELPQAEYFDDDSLLVVENQGVAQKVSGKQVKALSEAAAKQSSEAAAAADQFSKDAKASAKKAMDAVVNAPKIGGSGNWLVWDFELGSYVDSGVAAGGTGAANAVLYTEQTLTASEKAQARKNIGASNVEVTYENIGSASIVEMVVVDPDGNRHAFDPRGTDGANGGEWVPIYNEVNSTIEWVYYPANALYPVPASIPIPLVVQQPGDSETAVMSQKAVTEGLGGLAPLIVTITETDGAYTASETVTAIIKARDAGRSVYARLGDDIYPLTSGSDISTPAIVCTAKFIAVKNGKETTITVAYNKTTVDVMEYLGENAVKSIEGKIEKISPMALITNSDLDENGNVTLAGEIVMNADGGADIVPRTGDEIYLAYVSGRYVTLTLAAGDFEGLTLPCTGADPELVTFGSDDGLGLITVYLSDGVGELYVFEHGEFVITIRGNSEDGYNSNITLDELYFAYEIGRTCVCVLDTELMNRIRCPLLTEDGGVFTFGGSLFAGFMVGVNISSDGIEVIESVADVTIGNQYWDMSEPVDFTDEINRMIDEKVSDIPNGGTNDNIPDYVRTEAERVAKVVQSRQNANTITFLACSDIHYSSPDNSTPISTASLIKEATTHMGQAMGIIRGLVHIDFAAMFGDMVRDNGEANQDEIQAEVRFVNSCLHDGFSGIPSLRLEGNHDEAYESGVGLSAGQVFANIHAWNTGVVFGDRAVGYCYRDFEDQKLRVICLNTSEGTGSSIKVSSEQFTWLTEVLDLSEKGNDWRSVILSHHPLDFNRNGGVDPIPAVKAAAGLIGTFHGHIHNFVVGDITGTEVKRIAIPNAVRDQENSYASTAIYDEGKKYTKTAGTAEDTSFCVVTIDLAAQKIYADHYGAGYSREIDYTVKSAGPGYTNLVPNSIDPATQAIYGVDYNGDGTPDGYKNDVYGSGAGEGSSPDTDCVLTGLIAYGNGRTDPIYIKGADVTTASHCRILGFNGSYECYFQSAAGSAISTYFTVETLGDKYYKVTPIAGAITGDTTYLRFSLIAPAGGAELVITINEPIE